jgi:NAD(P)-dependent dehydrogenase (short-subunit alcohol dehydrogenase family)
MDLGLRGKVALVTGASKGMGKACAMGLAAEGARVAMCARNEGDLKAAVEEVKATTKAEVMGLATDVTKIDQVRALVGRVKDTFGSPDVLIANCGGPPRGFFDDFDDAARQSADIPMGRVGTAEEFASVAVFLASERASYVTGVAVQVDGGLVRGLL